MKRKEESGSQRKAEKKRGEEREKERMRQIKLNLMLC